MNTASDAQTLVDLLGETRATLVHALRGKRLTVAAIAGELGLSEVAVRRHLGLLERDGLVHAETVRYDRPGRPGAAYSLTERARRLFGDRNAELATELLDYLEESQGRKALLDFLRWRQTRQAERYAATLPEVDGQPPVGSELAERAGQLAELLTEDGFPSDVAEVTAAEGGTVLELRQSHCAIAEVAEAHPELCSYEAALFRDLLGVRVSRRQTIAGGAPACVCSITPASRTLHQVEQAPERLTAHAKHDEDDR